MIGDFHVAARPKAGCHAPQRVFAAGFLVRVTFMAVILSSASFTPYHRTPREIGARAVFNTSREEIISEVNVPDTLQPCGVFSTTEMSGLDREVTLQGKATAVSPWYGVHVTSSARKVLSRQKTPPHFRLRLVLLES